MKTRIWNKFNYKRARVCHTFIYSPVEIILYFIPAQFHSYSVFPKNANNISIAKNDQTFSGYSCSYNDIYVYLNFRNCNPHILSILNITLRLFFLKFYFSHICVILQIITYSKKEKRNPLRWTSMPLPDPFNTTEKFDPVSRKLSLENRIFPFIG